jgi:Outer membrane protein Omp28
MKKIVLIFQIFFITIIFYSCESNDSPVNNNSSGSNIPQLLSPVNNSTISTLQPTFDWIDYPNATSYKLQLSQNSAFTSLILDTVGLTTSGYTSSTAILGDSNSYFWRVKGVNNSDTSDWSNTFLFSTAVTSINPTNKVLIEMFTNTSCIPCVEANTYLDEIYDLHGVTSNDASVVILRYHTTLFAGDPFYLYNTTDNDARMAFYPNSAIVNPRTFLLGTFIGNYSASPWTNKINDKLAENRTYAIKLTNSYDTISRSGNINIKIKEVSGSVLNDLVYQVAVSENEIPYTAQNGETHFNNTFRDFITPSNGQPFTISPGQTNDYNQSYTIDTQINQDKTDLVVFVQRNNSSGRDVLAVETVSLK